MAKPYKYEGILGKPRSLKLPLAAMLLYPDDERLQRQAIAALKKQDDELFDALFADCDIRRDDGRDDLLGWMKLAKALARRHVPAFQPSDSRGRGRPSRDDWALAEEVVDLMKARNLTVRSACVAIAKRRHHRSTAKQIENRFYYTMRGGKAAKAEVQRLLKKSRRISNAKTAG